MSICKKKSFSQPCPFELAESSLGHKLFLPDESGFSRLEKLRLACVQLNLGGQDDTTILKFLQSVTGNRTLDLRIWEELLILTLSAQISSNKTGSEGETSPEPAVGEEELLVFADNKRVLDQLLRLDSFHSSLFRTEANFETISSKDFNR